jgi:molybdenum cofactor cytidylyltransferase
MIFAERPVESSTGTILAHSIRAGAGVMKKGRKLSHDDVAALREAGIASVTTVELEPDDVAEDEAARRIATALAGPHLEVRPPFTGRANLHAGRRGLLLVDRDGLDRINLVSEAVTVATLDPFELVASGEMAATVKIIPFAVPNATVAGCVEAAEAGSPVLAMAPLRGRSAALIQTVLSGTKPSLPDKTSEITRTRLEELESAIVVERRCAHRVADLAEAVAETMAAGPKLLLISGASAITDRRDVIPAALERAGGRVVHFGMPVDPGNLLLVGRLGDVPVLGLPGCARSPKLNGFDWVLRRFLCDLPVGPEDVMRMGVGGLLKEIPSRPQPRADQPRPGRAAAGPHKVAAIVLAAGRSSRMGSNKLLVELEGEPLLLRAVDAALASRAAPVIVVTGHEAERVRSALRGRRVTLVHNPNHAAGLSSSVKAGLAALPAEADAALVCLGDMPRVGTATLDRLIAAFNPVEGRTVCVPVWNGKRGNPVLWGRQMFPLISDLAGDVGAKHLIALHPELVAEVPAADDGVLVDVDTPDALALILPKVPLPGA